MEFDRVEALIEALQLAPDDLARSRHLEGAGQDFFTLPDAAEELIGLVGEAKPDTEAHVTLLMLIEAALDAARMARENDQPEGAQFLAEMDEQLAARAEAGKLSSIDRIALGRAYVHAGLPPSEHLVMSPDNLDELAISAADVPDLDLDATLDSLRDEAGAEPMAIHMGLAEMMATLPVPLRAMIVGQIAQRPDDLYAHAGAYWLLDPDPALRLASAEGFLHRTSSGQTDAATIARLIGMRSWLPADKARDTLDRLIKDAIRRDVAGGAAPKAWKLHRIIASIPDGAGAQSFAVAAQAGGRRAIAMLLLKQGFGVTDAYLIPCSSATEQKQFLARIGDEIELQDVTIEHLRDAIATALGEGVEAGLLPAPGLIDVIEVCGLQELRPEPRSIQDMLEIVAPDGELGDISPQRLGRLVKRSDDWPEFFEVIDSWFEDSGEMHDRLEAAKTDTARERAMWRYLETRRGWWARMFARTALTLHAAKDRTWIEFAATAIALENGRDLKKTPIMEDIVWRSLANPHAPGGPAYADVSEESDIFYDDAPAYLAPEKKNELARLLKSSKISPDWLDGFVTAIVVSPKMVTPHRWLEPLFSVLQDLPSEDSLQRFLDIVMLRYNAANDETADPAALRARFKAQSAQAWKDWAAGFATATSEFKPSWPAKSMNKDDKAILRQIKEEASGSEDRGALTATLPIWLARRRELRS